MKTTYEIRANNCTGPLLCTIDVDTDERGYCVDPDFGRTGAVEAAARRGAYSRAVVSHAGGRRCGVNRETGTPGMSGVFSLRSHGANCGAIHVAKV